MRCFTLRFNMTSGFRGGLGPDVRIDILENGKVDSVQIEGVGLLSKQEQDTVLAVIGNEMLLDELAASVALTLAREGKRA